MRKAHTFLYTALGLLTLLSTSNVANAIVLDPSISLLLIPPTVESVSPTFNERVVVPASTNSKRTIAVQFDSNIEFVGNPLDAVVVTNIGTGSPIPLDDVSIHKNMLYIYSTAFTHDSTDGTGYTAWLNGSRIRRIGGTTMADGGLGWGFTIANGFDTIFPPIHENIPKITINQNVFSGANLAFSGTDSRHVVYRVSVTNNSEGYTVNNLTVKAVLPSGFVYDGLTFGTDVTVSGSRVLTFNIGTPITPSSTKIFDYRVSVPSTLADGVYDSSAMATAEFSPSGINSDRYSLPARISHFDDNRADDDNVTISHLTPTPTPTPTPTTTASPTPSSTSTPTSTSTPSATPTSTSTALSHPSSDPLTCLRLNGAVATSFSDVPSSLLEAPYVSFLNTTVFASNPDVRLSRGYANGTFGTNNTLTRFELTKMALGANCINYNESPAPNRAFSDVPTDNSEMSLVIGKAKSLGIVQGIGNQFFPNRPVSYGEMVKILVGSGVYFDRGTPTRTLTHTLSGITDESFRQFAEYSARMNLVNLNGSAFPQNDSVQRRYMAQAVARYIAWLKNISLL